MLGGHWDTVGVGGGTGTPLGAGGGAMGHPWVLGEAPLGVWEGGTTL